MEATPLTNAVDPVSEGRIAQETSLHTGRAAEVGKTEKPASPAQEEPKESSATASTEDVAKVIAEDMNEVARVLNTSLNFSVDKPTGKTVIKVVDKETEETIRQLPPEEMLSLMRKMKNMMGMLLDIEV